MVDLREITPSCLSSLWYKTKKAKWVKCKDNEKLVSHAEKFQTAKLQNKTCTNCHMIQTEYGMGCNKGDFQNLGITRNNSLNTQNDTRDNSHKLQWVSNVWYMDIIEVQFLQFIQSFHSHQMHVHITWPMLYLWHQGPVPCTMSMAWFLSSPIFCDVCWLNEAGSPVSFKSSEHATFPAYATRLGRRLKPGIIGHNFLRANIDWRNEGENVAWAGRARLWKYGS